MLASIGRASQVEVAVLEAQGLVDLAGVAGLDLEGRRLGGVEHLELVDAHLDLAGRQVRVHRLRRACDDRAARPRARTRRAPSRRRRAPPASATGRTTICTTPERSRRSMKMSPPWSRRCATQPASRTSRPTSWRRSSPGYASRSLTRPPRRPRVLDRPELRRGPVVDVARDPRASGDRRRAAAPAELLDPHRVGRQLLEAEQHREARAAAPGLLELALDAAPGEVQLDAPGPPGAARSATPKASPRARRRRRSRRRRPEPRRRRRHARHGEGDALQPACRSRRPGVGGPPICSTSPS